jgi:antitoxin MazE
LEVAAMITKVQKWGNSQGLRLSKELLADVEIEVGDAVDVAARDGILVVTPVRRVRGRVALEQLVREIPADYRPGELDWGPPAGQEVW